MPLAHISQINNFSFEHFLDERQVLFNQKIHLTKFAKLFFTKGIKNTYKSNYLSPEKKTKNQLPYYLTFLVEKIFQLKLRDCK